MGTVYVGDYGNQITRWLKGSVSGSVLIGEQGEGNGTAQLSEPIDLVFDRQGNLYVVDRQNSRIQMFAIDKSSCNNGIYRTNVIH
jgi:hypothetical protein